ncbi:hypothetical protein ABFG93_12100 [Pseudalkalibacillus hwajinpoensis]|uniref:hypothetical protein n=1 Tax=Guptibacillus hwajinpoensis TaxID=208199 RepID=UPI00325A4927
MKNQYFLLAVLFHFIAGCFSFLILDLWVMVLIYVGDLMGFINDPTLDEGLLLFFLLTALVASAIYFPIVVFTSIYLRSRLQITKARYLLIMFGIFLLSLVLTFCVVYQL